MVEEYRNQEIEPAIVVIGVFYAAGLVLTILWLAARLG